MNIKISYFSSFSATNNISTSHRSVSHFSVKRFTSFRVWSGLVLSLN